MLTRVISVIFTFILFQFTNAPATLQTTTNVLITEENIQNIYPYPALVVDREKVKRYRFTIPSNADITCKDALPYTIFINKKYLCPENNHQIQNDPHPYATFDPHDYCLVEKTNIDFSQPILCESEVEPLIIEIPSWKRWKNLGRKCGTGKSDKHYVYLYQECRTYKKTNEKLQKLSTMIEKIGEVELLRNSINLFAYEFCYDTTNNELTYTYHTIRSPKLLRNKSLDLERSIIFPMKTETYGLFDDNLFKEIEEAFEQNQYSMIAQKLVPSDDMEMGLLRKPTFHYVNVKPMHEKLVPIWEVFNKRIEELASRDTFPLKIYTTTIGVLMNDERMRLFLADNRTTIPEIWCKLIIHRSEKKRKPKKDRKTAHGVAFLLHNFVDQNLPTRDPYCEMKICNVSNWKDVIGNEIRNLAGKYAYCCEVSEKILDLFPLLNLNKDEVETLTEITSDVF